MATKGQKQVIRTEKEKYEIIKPVLENFKSQTQVSKETGINVGLIFQWIKKYNEKGMEGLKNKWEDTDVILTEKETTTIQDLQTQEQACIDKYNRYSKEAHDEVLKDLFSRLADEEQKHFDSLGQVLNGKVPSCDCNDSDGKDYNPKATYDQLTNSDDKKEDNYLATDCIGTEKLVSGEYNSDVFNFSNSDVRKLLADIQVEEQNHAEMLYKYKTVNGMS